MEAKTYHINHEIDLCFPRNRKSDSQTKHKSDRPLTAETKESTLFIYDGLMCIYAAVDPIAITGLRGFADGGRTIITAESQD